MKAWMKKNWTMLVLVIVFALGLCLLLYPSVSNYVNSFHSSRVISSYEEQLSKMTPEDYKSYVKDAEDYNTKLAGMGSKWVLSEKEQKEYNQLLNIGGVGVMGYIEIEKLNVSLPIYHGTSEEVLQVGVGHLAGSSLPVGGESTHAVLSGHRGLPSAKLFTHLDKLVEGDFFVLHIMNETLTYEVDQILIVEPDDTSALGITEGKDYVTLVTCTPYGINTHRLLVRGHRVSNMKDGTLVPADGIQMDPGIIAPIVAAPLLFGLFIAVVVSTKRKKKERKVFAEAMSHMTPGSFGRSSPSQPEELQPKQKKHRKKGKQSEKTP